MRLHLLAFLIFGSVYAMAGSEAASSIEGCYEPPTTIDSGKLRLTSFKDVLLLGDAARGPRYIAITKVAETDGYEFWFFDSTEVKERYRITKERNKISPQGAGITFSVCRRASAEGVKWKSCGVMTLVPTSATDLRVDVEIMTENRSLFFFSKKEQTRLSFDLKRLGDRRVESLTIGGALSDLPGSTQVSAR